jgi:DNA end-binding protein Ku
VNIPVKLVSAVQQEELDLDMLSKKELAPVRYARIDTKTGEELAWKDIVKGYQYSKGKYVVVEDKDFESASPEKSKSIDIAQFTREEEIDPIYYEKSYYIMPGKGGEKSYKLLVKALDETKSVGIAEFMLRNRMHVCSVKAHNGQLLLTQMRYHTEIKEAPELDLGSQRVSPKEVALAVKLVEQLTDEFNPASFKDTYVEEMKKIIKAKAAGKQIRVVTEPKKATGTVKDLMAVLKESLNTKTKKRA